jgi:hydroxyethylthiazole kinase-like sugar kinase family protein
MLIVLVALSSAALAAEPAAQASPPQGLPKVCVDATGDTLTKEFADRLKEAITASGALAVVDDSCELQMHVPGNLLRFETASGVMVSTVVFVTSPSGRYLSSSIAACQASNLKPCAVHAVAAAKLALVMKRNGGN